MIHWEDWLKDKCKQKGWKCHTRCRYLKGHEDNKALAKHEVDGWLARDGDLGNMHRSVGQNKYKVVFFKYIDKERSE